MSTSSTERSNNNIRTNDIKDMVNYPLQNKRNKEGEGVAGRGTIEYTLYSAAYYHHTLDYNKKNKVKPQ